MCYVEVGVGKGQKWIYGGFTKPVGIGKGVAGKMGRIVGL